MSALPILLGVVAILVVVMAVVVFVGARLPESHTVSRSVLFDRSPEDVWQAVREYPRQITWRRGLSRVERLPDTGGRDVWRESAGRHVLTLMTIVDEPRRRLVRRIVDVGLPFSGEWEFRLEAVGGGCRLTLTERGEVHSPVFRFVSTYLMSPAVHIENYLRDLTAYFGKTSDIGPSAAA